MTQLCRIIVYFTSLLFQSIPSNACVSFCMIATPGKFNVCGQDDCSKYIDCTNSFSGYTSYCTNLEQFDESVGSCTEQSSTCPSVNSWNWQPVTVVWPSGIAWPSAVPWPSGVTWPSADVTAKINPPAMVITTSKASAVTATASGLIVTWHYHARPNINASAVVTGLPHVLACVRMCQADPLCQGLSLEENHRPEHPQCFLYYERWTELTYDQHFITYILK